jgi:multifunctional cyclase/dehydratase/O-methyltransferase
MGYIASRCLHVIAERVGHAALGDASATPEQLAHATRCDAGFLVRVLRLLAGEGVFEEVDGRYRHTPASRLLRSDEAHSLRAFIRFTGGSLPWQAYGELGRAVQAGQTPADLVAPGGLWTYLQEHPDVGALFNEAMAGKAHEEIAAVLGAHAFSRFGTVADIGGHGHLIRAIRVDTKPRGPV